MKVYILTPWIGTGKGDDPYRPRVSDDYKMSWVKITEQMTGQMIPEPNLFMIRADVDEKVLEQIRQDGKYLVLNDSEESAATDKTDLTASYLEEKSIPTTILADSVSEKEFIAKIDTHLKDLRPKAIEAIEVVK